MSNGAKEKTAVGESPEPTGSVCVENAQWCSNSLSATRAQALGTCSVLFFRSSIAVEPLLSLTYDQVCLIKLTWRCQPLSAVTLPLPALSAALELS